MERRSPPRRVDDFCKRPGSESGVPSRRAGALRSYAFISLHFRAMRPKIHNAIAAKTPMAAKGIHTCRCG